MQILSATIAVYIERWNCALRQRLRRTLSFSKCERLHELAWCLFIRDYNQQPVLKLIATTQA